LEFSSFLQEGVKGALVRSRFLQLKDMDGLLFQPGEIGGAEEADDLLEAPRR